MLVVLAEELLHADDKPPEQLFTRRANVLQLLPHQLVDLRLLPEAQQPGASLGALHDRRSNGRSWIGEGQAHLKVGRDHQLFIFCAQGRLDPDGHARALLSSTVFPCRLRIVLHEQTSENSQVCAVILVGHSNQRNVKQEIEIEIESESESGG